VAEQSAASTEVLAALSQTLQHSVAHFVTTSESPAR
jgi:hypothetical protein